MLKKVFHRRLDKLLAIRILTYIIKCVEKSTNKIMKLEKLIKASKLSKKEVAFINKIAKSAFAGNDRPLVIIGIANAILSNVINMSNGGITEKTVLSLMKGGLEVK